MNSENHSSTSSGLEDWFSFSSIVSSASISSTSVLTCSVVSSMISSSAVVIFSSSSFLKNERLKRIRINTPTVIAASAILNTGLKNSNRFPQF